VRPGGKHTRNLSPVDRLSPLFIYTHSVVQRDKQMRGDTRNTVTDRQKPSESSQQPGATVIVVNMGATAPETSTPQSPHGSPKGANLKIRRG